MQVEFSNEVMQNHQHFFANRDKLSWKIETDWDMERNYSYQTNVIWFQTFSKPESTCKEKNYGSVHSNKLLRAQKSFQILSSSVTWFIEIGDSYSTYVRD